MSRTIYRKPRGPLPAIDRAFVAFVMMLALLAPSIAWAGTPYSIVWFHTEANGSCESADIQHHDGEPFFRLNDTPLPTYQIPGAFVTNADGTQNNTAEAGFDSVLLRTGTNGFFFSVRNSSGDDSCVFSREVATLVSVPLGLNKPLFDVQRNGTAFYGNTQLDLSLVEINPQLAKDIALFEQSLTSQRETLFAGAAQIADLAVRLTRLKQLDAELSDLVTRPLDEIDTADLDAILDEYADVIDDDTRAALEQVIEDLQKSIDDLHAELASLIDNFGDQADATADLATQAARASGFDPDDPSGYALGPNDVPAVEFPDISGVPGAWSAGNDPYDAYADAVISALGDNISNGQVLGRADFIAQVRAWRANEAALAKALMSGGASQAETSAFLKGQEKVRAYVKQFLDSQDWFADSPIPADVRGYVDGPLKVQFGQLTDQLKDAINALPHADAIDLTQTPLFQAIRAFGGMVEAVGDGALAYRDMMVSIVEATARVGVGFVPVVGPALDFCEAVSGRAWCLPGGQELSTEQRIFAGAGVAVGAAAKFWGGVKAAGVGAKAVEVAEDVAKVDEAIAKGLHANPRNWYKTLKGACTSKALEDFEKVAGRYLQQEGHALLGIGDDGVRFMLEIPTDGTGLAEDAAKAADYLSVNKGNKLVISEVKGGDGIHLFDKNNGALRQLKNTAKRLIEKGLSGDIDAVQIIVKKGVTFTETDYAIVDGYLVVVSTGKRYEMMVSGIKKLVRVIEP